MRIVMVSFNIIDCSLIGYDSIYRLNIVSHFRNGATYQYSHIYFDSILDWVNKKYLNIHRQQMFSHTKIVVTALGKHVNVK